MTVTHRKAWAEFCDRWNTLTARRCRDSDNGTVSDCANTGCRVWRPRWVTRRPSCPPCRIRFRIGGTADGPRTNRSLWCRGPIYRSTLSASSGWGPGSTWLRRPRHWKIIYIYIVIRRENAICNCVYKPNDSVSEIMIKKRYIYIYISKWRYTIYYPFV